MIVRVTLKPGQKGTKALLKHYGDWSVCFRFPYDKIRHKRYKTVELIVDEDASLEGLRNCFHMYKRGRLLVRRQSK